MGEEVERERDGEVEKEGEGKNPLSKLLPFEDEAKSPALPNEVVTTPLLFPKMLVAPLRQNMQIKRLH